MSTRELELYELLKIKIGEKETKALFTHIDETTQEKIEQKKDVLATKEDIAKVRIEAKETKADIIKWMFIFWIGSISVIAGIMIALFNAYIK